MTRLDPIVQAIEFTEAHLHDPINVADMAGAAAYSLYHFCRMFGKFTRHTPYDYMMRRRMTLAAGDVLQTDRRIVDIAMDYRFASHEGFTRAFQRMFGINPADARQQGCVPAASYLPRLTGEHLDCLQRQQGLIPTLIDLPPASGATRRLPAAQVWPANASPSGNGTIISGGLYGCFSLIAGDEDLPLILDWALHVWLFYAPYTLRLPFVLFQGAQLCVPVAQRTA